MYKILTQKLIFTACLFNKLKIMIMAIRVMMLAIVIIKEIVVIINHIDGSAARQHGSLSRHFVSLELWYFSCIINIDFQAYKFVLMGEK